MRLKQLQAQYVRNLKPLKAAWHPQWNILLGPNGAGKTSVLEAIHLLSVGRSFRSRHSKSVITYEQPQLSCFGEVETPAGDTIALGIEKNRQGASVCKVQTQVCQRLSEFVSVLPTHLITPETLKLLTAGPNERRRFMDWGVFHVEPQMGATYQRYQRLLKQRNAALKLSRQLTVFDVDLSTHAEAIHQARQGYVIALQPYLSALLSELLPDLSCTMAYEAGWPSDTTFSEALVAGFGHDQRLGYTRLGPHAADLQITAAGYPAQQVLSRGQLKLVVFAAYMAQAQHLSDVVGKQCVYLLDDLVSELDAENRWRLMGVIARQGHQVFLTGSDPASWQTALESFEHQLFHVEQGQLQKA